LGPGPVIGSLSLGGTRRFMLRHRAEKGLKHQLELTSGSFLLMQGTTQHYWQHHIRELPALLLRVSAGF
jgi:alkylated DNA repair dioxygenase AlkB